jgi:PAS domain S-box-containing protein
MNVRALTEKDQEKGLQPPLRILLLEDNPDDAELIANELQYSDFEFVLQHVDSPEFYKIALQDFRPDLILSDYDLPLFTGVSALAEAKSKCPDIPFILVTGAVSEEIAIEILTNGARDYVLKNRISRLVPAVKRALAEAEAQKARKKAEEELLEAHRILEQKVKERTRELNAEILERKRVEKRTAQQNVILSGIARIFHEALTCQAEEELARFCLSIAEEVTQSKFGFIGEINYRTGRLDVVISNPGQEPCSMESAITTKTGMIGLRIGGLYGRVIQHGKGFFTNAPSSHPDSSGVPEGHPLLKSFLGVPLIQGGQVIGVIVLGNREGGYGREELEALEVLAPTIVQAFLSKQAEKAMRESEERFRNLLQMIPNVAVQGYGPNGITRYWNKASEDLYNYTAQEAIGRNLLDLVIPEPMKENAKAAIQQMVEKGQTIPPSELSMMPKDGSRISVYSSHAIIKIPGREPESFCIQIDLTELKRAEEELFRMHEDLKIQAEQLKDANKELEFFSYSVSHDLRTPLRTIGGFTSALIKSVKSKLEADELRRLDIILDSTRKMDHLINDLLDFSRIARTEMYHHPFDMKRLTKEVWQEQLAANMERNLELKMGDLRKAYGDSILIRQVLSNLLANAIKFTKRKKIALIEIGCEFSETEDIYYIKDNGAGFDMKYYERLFHVFQRLHSESDYEGTGIGLAIVQRIIHRHGGRVWAEGRIGKGATFYFSLPRHQKGEDKQINPKRLRIS